MRAQKKPLPSELAFDAFRQGFEVVFYNEQAVGFDNIDFEAMTERDRNPKSIFCAFFDGRGAHHRCRKSFKTNVDLVRHEEQHIDKFIPCGYDNCEERFRQNSHRETHITARHTNEKPWACSCKYEAADRSAMSRHLKTKNAKSEEHHVLVRAPDKSMKQLGKCPKSLEPKEISPHRSSRTRVAQRNRKVASSSTTTVQNEPRRLTKKDLPVPPSPASAQQQFMDSQSSNPPPSPMFGTNDFAMLGGNNSGLYQNHVSGASWPGSGDFDPQWLTCFASSLQPSQVHQQPLFDNSGVSRGPQDLMMGCGLNLAGDLVDPELHDM